MAETEITVQVFEDLMTVCNKLENLGFEKTRKFKGKKDIRQIVSEKPKDGANN